MTTRALSQSALVLKSTSVPAKPKPPSYEVFDDFIVGGEAIKCTVDSMHEAMRKLESVLWEIDDGRERLDRHADVVDECGPLDADGLARLIEDISAFRASLDYYTRAEVCDHDNRKRVRRAVISEQVAVLIGSVPSAQPHNPKIYTTMMEEEINAAHVGPITLELACRHLRRDGSNFTPSIPEMLKALRAQQARIESIAHAANTDVEELNANLTKLHQKAKRGLKIARQKQVQREQERQKDAERERLKREVLTAAAAAEVSWRNTSRARM